MDSRAAEVDSPAAEVDSRAPRRQRCRAASPGGNIIAQDSGSITVKLDDGSTKIILIPGSTTIAVTPTGTASDLAVGKDVTVIGATNSDGTVTATQIQIGTLPGLGGRPAGAGGTGAATPTTAAQ